MPEQSEQDRLLDHSYDGIQEYDNPLPRWWLWTFWATILFAVIYLLNVPGVGAGKGRIANYEAEMAKARELAAKHDPLALLTDDSLRRASRHQPTLELGKATFASMCSSCHAADGGGGIGPNLTDLHWLHGDTPMQIIGTINGGVLEKGMPAWGKLLRPDQLTAVAAYVLSLQGTHPAAPKAPQGTRADSAAPRPGG